MFCIFAFVLFMILGIFSARYRSLAKKAWGCVWIRLTFRTCDISLQQEIRSRFIGRYVVTKPRLARFLTRWVDTIAFIFVALSVWSLLVVLNSGINYYVYDTCSPSDPESCSLSAGACGVGSYRPGFYESLKTGNIFTWVSTESVAYADKLSRIPDRMKKWEAKDFVSSTATYYYAFDESKPIAIEMIDPGCTYCAQMLERAKEVDFAKKYNFTYLLYPIPNPEKEGEYKFKNSYLIARYIEATKKYRNEKDVTPADWRILENIYTGKNIEGVEYQKLFNEEYSDEEARAEISKWLSEFGYSKDIISKIASHADSDEVKNLIKEQADIVNNKVRTVKIPTIIFNDRRYDRLVDTETLLR